MEAVAEPEDRQLAVAAQPVATGEYLAAPGRSGVTYSRGDGARRQTHVKTLHVLTIRQLLQAPTHNTLQFGGIGRFIVQQSRQPHADQRRIDRLVGAAFTTQSQAGRRAGDNEFRAVIQGIG